MASTYTYCEDWGPSNRIYWMDAVPSAYTDGIYQVGDWIVLNTPLTGQPYIWVCTVAGVAGSSAGTFKSISLS